MVKMLILHADDSPRFRNLVAATLSSDYDVFSVRDCDEVVTALQKRGVDLVILDHLMPGSASIDTGFEVCQHVRREFPGLPVVIFTGAWEGVEVDRAELEAKWGARIVFKNQGGADLKRVVDQLLAARRADEPGSA
jgi:CheY-like chemotaxis protein